MLDSNAYDKKPSQKEASYIQKRLINCKIEKDLKDIMFEHAQGYTLKMGIMKGMKNEDWEGQYLFGVDFDDGWPLEEALAYCRKYQIEPCAVVASSNHLKDKKDGKGIIERYHMFFCMPAIVEDIRLREAIQRALEVVFKGRLDSSCKDATRMFFGGKELLYLDEEATLCPAYLIAEVVINCLRERNIDSLKRDLKSFCASANLAHNDGMPAVNLVISTDESRLSSNLTVSREILYYNYRDSRKTIKTCLFLFTTDRLSIKTTKKGYSVQKGQDTDIDIKREGFEKYDFGALEEDCLLYKAFISGQLWPTYEQIKGITTNLAFVKGGIKKVSKALEIYKNEYPTEDSYCNAQNCVTNVSRNTTYAPMSCCNINCPYYAECQNEAKNMLALGLSKASAKSCIELKEETEEPTKPLDGAVEEAQRELGDYLNDTFDKRTLFMLLGPTGGGKTTILERLQTQDGIDFSSMIIALPTHKCMDDVYPRIAKGDYIISKPLMLEDEIMQKEYNRLVSIGQYKAAKDLINSIAIEEADVEEVKARKQRDIEKVKEYLTIEAEIRVGTHKTVFCTHKKAMLLEKEATEDKTLIVDEDILLSCLFEQTVIVPSEIDRAIKICQENKIKGILSTLNEIISKVTLAKANPLHLQKMDAKCTIAREITKFRKIALEQDIDFDIKKYLKITALASCENGAIAKGYYVNELPFKKVVVMSATAKPFMYQALYPKTKVVVHDMGNIQAVGQNIHHHVSTSRSALNRVSKATCKPQIDKIVERIEAEAPDIKNMITFKSFKSQFEEKGFNVIATFGNCMGVDAYKGQDLLVVGTPHVDNLTYFLLASAIEEDINVLQDFRMTSIKKNGFQFNFNTYVDANTETGSLLHDIQMYLIETELIQAVGRARILREDCVVHDFTNLPLKGAKLYVPKKTKKKNT